MAIFWLVPALFMYFYFKNGFNRYSKVVNILLRTVISIVAAIVLYYVYYKTSHLFLGTQKGFSHPQQFPMIPLIWFINIMLINYWFMDGWPGWRLEKQAEKQIEDEKVIHTSFQPISSLSPAFYKGAAGGVVGGVVLYFIIIYLIPLMGSMLIIFE